MRLLWQVVVPPTVLVVALLLMAGVVDGSATDPGTLAARAAGGAAVSVLVVLVLRRVGERAVSPAREGSLTKRARAAVTDAAAGFLAWTVPAVLALVRDVEDRTGVA